MPQFAGKDRKRLSTWVLAQMAQGAHVPNTSPQPSHAKLRLVFRQPHVDQFIPDLVQNHLRHIKIPYQSPQSPDDRGICIYSKTHKLTASSSVQSEHAIHVFYSYNCKTQRRTHLLRICVLLFVSLIAFSSIETNRINFCRSI
jgi:hypothetical protein